MAVKLGQNNQGLTHFTKLRNEANQRPILVTGANGFKGTWLIQLLQTLRIPFVGIGLETKAGALWSRIPSLSNENFQIVDIRNYQTVKSFINHVSPTIIIHLAAQPLVEDGYINPLETFDTNVNGTMNLIELSLTNGVKVFQAVTTDKVYKISTDKNQVFSEVDPLGGADPYSCSKVAAEEIVKGYRSIPKFKNTNIFSVRAGNVIGGGDGAPSRLLPDIVRSLKSNSPLRLRYPNAIRPWQHVLDPLHGYLLSIEKSLEGSKFEALNFGPDSRKSLSVKDVVEIAKSKWNSNTTLDVRYAQNEIFHETNVLQLSSHLACQELGWSPSWSQEEAVKATIDWELGVYNNQVDESEACQIDIQKLLLNNKIKV